MFDLEASIADWRKQMLAAGIQAPVPLEELEIHLREEVERQGKLGLHESEAFHSAAQKIGQPESLKIEFKRNGSFSDFLLKHRYLKASFVLGLIWLVYYGGYFWNLGFAHLPYLFNLQGSVLIFVFGTGLIGSVLLIFDSKWGCKIIRTNALIFTAMCVMTYATGFGGFSSNFGALVFFALCLVSILLLHWPKHNNSVILK